ncbi:MAG: hypothetical protein V4558_04020 [Gemmatimonadota bacterium]
MRDRLLFFLMLCLLTPIGPELGEWAFHFAGEGDFVHASAPSHPGSMPEPEHGCSTTQHVCGCHSGLSIVPDRRLIVSSPTTPPATPPEALPCSIAPQAHPEPGLRPPII